MTTDANTPVSDPNPDNLDDVNFTLDDEPKPDAKPEGQAPAADEAGEVYEYNNTGDVGLDMALAFVGKAGISEKHPAMVAAQTGDFSILKATLAAKGIPGWEQFVALGEQAVSKRTAAATEAKNAVKKMVVEAAGGEQEWNDVQKWASANATPEEKAEINAMLNKGGVAAKSAINYLMNAYSKAGNVVVNPADPTANAGRGGRNEGANAPLSGPEYAAEVAKLNGKLGGRLEGSPEYAKLQARRQAYRG